MLISDIYPLHTVLKLCAEVFLVRPTQQAMRYNQEFQALEFFYTLKTKSGKVQNGFSTKIISVSF